MNADNPIVRLCVEGMRLEGLGKPTQAKVVFAKAWEEKRNDFEGCIAAHYLARHQLTPEETLHWNQEALRLAQAVGDERVEGFYPSLYLNLGHSYEQLGDLQEAERWYRLAKEKASGLGEDRYGSTVREGIENGLRRSKKNLPS